jgi:hypothetical protein
VCGSGQVIDDGIWGVSEHIGMNRRAIASKIYCGHGEFLIKRRLEAGLSRGNDFANGKASKG